MSLSRERDTGELMKLWSVLLAMILVPLAACSKGPAAEKRYEVVAHGGTEAEKCAEAGKVADAYLSDGDEVAYRRWRLEKTVACLAAESDSGLSGLMDAGGGEVLEDAAENLAKE